MSVKRLEHLTGVVGELDRVDGVHFKPQDLEKRKHTLVEASTHPQLSQLESWPSRADAELNIYQNSINPAAPQSHDDPSFIHDFSWNQPVSLTEPALHFLGDTWESASANIFTDLRKFVKSNVSSSCTRSSSSDVYFHWKQPQNSKLLVHKQLNSSRRDCKYWWNQVQIQSHKSEQDCPLIWTVCPSWETVSGWLVEWGGRIRWYLGHGPLYSVHKPQVSDTDCLQSSEHPYRWRHTRESFYGCVCVCVFSWLCGLSGLTLSTLNDLALFHIPQGHRGETLPKTELISDISLLQITAKRW